MRDPIELTVPMNGKERLLNLYEIIQVWQMIFRDGRLSTLDIEDIEYLNAHRDFLKLLYPRDDDHVLIDEFLSHLMIVLMTKEYRDLDPTTLTPRYLIPVEYRSWSPSRQDWINPL
jgi:hypothetical protein